MVHGEFLIKSLKRLNAILLKRDLGLFMKRHQPGPFSLPVLSCCFSCSLEKRLWLCSLVFLLPVAELSSSTSPGNSGESRHRAPAQAFVSLVLLPRSQALLQQRLLFLHLKLLLQSANAAYSNSFASETFFGVRPVRILRVYQAGKKKHNQKRGLYGFFSLLPEVSDPIQAPHHDVTP